MIDLEKSKNNFDEVKGENEKFRTFDQTLSLRRSKSEYLFIFLIIIRNIFRFTPKNTSFRTNIQDFPRKITKNQTKTKYFLKNLKNIYISHY